MEVNLKDTYEKINVEKKWANNTTASKAVYAVCRIDIEKVWRAMNYTKNGKEN